MSKIKMTDENVIGLIDAQECLSNLLRSGYITQKFYVFLSACLRAYIRQTFLQKGDD
jgi:hypothetical protein